MAKNDVAELSTGSSFPQLAVYSGVMGAAFSSQIKKLKNAVG